MSVVTQTQLLEVDRIRAEVVAVLEKSFTNICSCGLRFNVQDAFLEHKRFTGHRGVY